MPTEAVDRIASVPRWELSDGRLVLKARTDAGRKVELVFVSDSPEAWAMTLRPEGTRPPRPTPMVAGHPAKPSSLSVIERDGKLAVRGPELALEIGLRRFAFRFVDGSGHAVLDDNPGDVDGLGRPSAPGLGIVLRRGLPGGLTASFHLAPEERLYGLGEKFTRVEKTGQRIVSWNRDALGSTSERSHKNIPFLWSSRGFGLFVDTGARIAWDLGASSLQSWTLRAECPSLTLRIYHGPDPARIIASYTASTGRAPAPPKWSFGLWLSSGGTYRDQASIEALLDEAERRGLPFDVVHIDPWWMRWRRYCDFRWDRRAFPSPERLIRRLRRLGLRLCLWEHPYISVESELFAEGKRKGFFVRRPDGRVYVIDYGLSLAPRPDGRVRLARPQETWNAPVAIIDLTHPEAWDWFKDLHRPLLRSGVDVFKTDFGEDIPEDAVFYDGSTGATMHNLYPLLYNQAVFEVTAEERGRGLVWARSGTAGSQRFPVVWSGDPASDFESLAATIRGGLSAGLSGLPFWSHDIGGYRGRPDSELYVRWAQFGLLSSHSRMHGDSPREPWRFGERAFRIVKRLVQLRYRLFPYIYSAALEACETGCPVIRALPLAFPDDRSASAWEHEYMFGPSFLVAPVIERMTGARGRKGGRPTAPAYLPEGDWFDYWTGHLMRGPRVVEAAAPLDRLPLYVRAGAVIPMAAGRRRIPEGRIDPLLLDVYPGRSRSSVTLREDEGTTDFILKPVGGGFILSWRGAIERGYRLRLRPGWRVGSVEITGKRRGLLPGAGKRAIASPPRGWVNLPRSREGQALVKTA